LAIFSIMRQHTLQKLKLTILIFSVVIFSSFQANERVKIAKEVEFTISKEILNKWYPQAMDTEYGGFLSTFTYDFKPTGPQDKMIVTQSRHTWSNSKASLFYPEIKHYKEGAALGAKFLKDVMWDKEFGGFYELVDRKGTPKEGRGRGGKTAYGNAFAIYALSAYYEASGDTSALNAAKKGFMWLERHSHDAKNKGYFQNLKRDGTPTISMNNKVGEATAKDQNSSIHLLEAFSQLYQVWPDALVRERLAEMFYLIRDTIVTEKGYLTLFLSTDWKPFSLRDSSEAMRERMQSLDHVSFGHDVETAYLLLEASHIAGLPHDEKTAEITKKMVDHSLATGWDEKVGGFYNEGYYLKEKSGITIIDDSKNWWSQAEGLNTLLIMADLYPNDKHQYFEKFKKLWNYIQTYQLDHENGDMFEWGTDKDPDKKKGFKGHLWKGNYHQLRALTNVLIGLTKEKVPPTAPMQLRKTFNEKVASLSWSPSSDNYRMLGYEILTNGKKIGFTPLTTFNLDPDLSLGQKEFEVRAVDLHGNYSKAVSIRL
jgi:cellobiose epimerase